MGSVTLAKTKKKRLDGFSMGVVGVSHESSRLAIKVLIPGDAGGKTAACEVKILGGCGGEIVERSICII